ncbi:helix-turn-helix domain-containing protein [Cupriavidus pampae]|uniref:HTH-type transcriptional activator RhaS n=1 Tax=Cupriavidus pampae TaxID=659251 RepID=A0ABM8XZL6_9BURK|nr:AraC family transcriptional regulator [Cupriavidus pampae]CAG9185904.1 HTH-type transcriptional activator RhaS [Cupriavidus pampae]
MMVAVKMMVFGKPGKLDLKGTLHSIDRATLVLADPASEVIDPSAEVATYSFASGIFQQIYSEMGVLTASYRSGTPFWRAPVKAVSLPAPTVKVLLHLAPVEPQAMLRFAYAYCLSQEPEYFSRLLHHLVDGSRDFFQFVEANSMSAWPTEQYARELGITVRKLNMLFYEKFGVSAKHWLLERRLQEAKRLLLHTSLKITDIAEECGFNSHSHFTVSFRRRFAACPRWIRQYPNGSTLINKD